MNCSEIDSTLEDGSQALRTDVGFNISMAVLAILSVAILCMGNKMARPVAACIAFAVVSVTSFRLLDSIPCMTRVIVALVAGVCASGLALCLLKWGVFVLGGAAAGALIHFAYDLLPMDSKESSQSVFGRSNIYYFSVFGASVIGGILTICLKQKVLMVVTSLIGSCGLAATLHFTSTRYEWRIPKLVFVVLLMLGTLTGIAVQSRFHRSRTTQRERTRRREAVQADC